MQIKYQIITLKLKLSSLNIIHVYAPITTYPDDVEVTKAQRQRQHNDITFSEVDFNQGEKYYKIMGNFGYSQRNYTGAIQMNFLKEQCLFIINLFFNKTKLKENMCGQIVIVTPEMKMNMSSSQKKGLPSTLQYTFYWQDHWMMISVVYIKSV